MKILIDLGHPAHIHYFKNFIWIMKENGHKFCLVSRDKEVLHELLNQYKFEFNSRGKGGRSIISKVANIFIADYQIYKSAKKFKPDIFMSFASTYAAHVSRIFKKPHIVFDDTEHAKYEIMMYSPFSDVILNPNAFWKNFSKKQLFFDSYMELSHLHPKYFIPDPAILKLYDIEPFQKYYIIRFVSWNASHDIGQTGLKIETKREIISKLEKHGKVIISSENELPNEFESYKIKINPTHLHHLLYYSSMYIGEGATTAAEAIILGTPAIYINSLNAGTIAEQQEKYGLVSLRDAKHIMSKIDIFLKPEAKIEANKNREKLLNEKIDITAFIVWFIENYPSSLNIVRAEPKFQYNFK